MKNKEKYNLSELSITIENGSVIINNINKKFNGLREYCEWLEEENGTWIPRKNDLYWFINCGEVFDDFWEDSKYDRILLEQHNVYKTEEEAQKALEMYEFCKERSFIPSWENENEARYHLALHHNVGVANCYEDEYVQDFAPFYYPNEKAVQEIINEYSFEDLEKYYGRV